MREQEMTDIPGSIEVYGARVHNLKNIDVDVPLHRLWASRAYPAPGSHPLRSASFTRRAPGATSSRSPPIRGGA